MSKNETTESTQIHLKGVRTVFPSLIRTELYKGDDTGKFTTTFIIPKSDKKLKAKIDAEIKTALSKISYKIPSDNICVKDGDDFDLEKYPYYEDSWIIKASKTKVTKMSTNSRPKLINRNGNFVTVNEEGKIVCMDKERNIVSDGTSEDFIYGGCYVYGIIDFWTYDGKNGGGKRLGANLLAVKFIKDGDRVGSVSNTEDFDDDFDMEEDDL